MTFIVEKRSELVPDAWCNKRIIDAESWLAARQAYVEAECAPSVNRDLQVWSPAIRCTAVSPLNPRH